MTTTPLLHSQANRRKASRKIPRTNVSVECRRGSLGLGKNLAAQFLDISEGGVRLTIKEALTPGEEVEVLLGGCQIGKAIKRLANVSWVISMENGGYCVGLEFEKRLLFLEVSRIAKP